VRLAHAHQSDGNCAQRIVRLRPGCRSTDLELEELVRGASVVVPRAQEVRVTDHGLEVVDAGRQRSQEAVGAFERALVAARCDVREARAVEV
jgi:hypothetical protein